MKGTSSTTLANPRRKSKVTYPGFFVLGKEDVGALDVAVDDAPGMEICKSERDIFGNVRLGLPALETPPPYRICQAATFDILHDNHVVMNMVELDNVSVGEFLHDSDFLFCALVRRIEKSLDHNVIESALGLKDFCLGTTANLFSQFNGVCLARACVHELLCGIYQA